VIWILRYCPLWIEEGEKEKRKGGGGARILHLSLSIAWCLEPETE